MRDSLLRLLNPLYTIGQPQRGYLIDIVGSVDAVSSVQKRIRSTRIKYWALAVPILLALSVTTPVAAIYIVGINNNYDIVIAAAALFSADFLLAYTVGRSSPEYWTFDALMTSLPKVDE